MVVIDGLRSLHNTEARPFLSHSSMVSSRGKDLCLSWEQRFSCHVDGSPGSANNTLDIYLTVFNCDLVHFFSHLYLPL